MTRNCPACGAESGPGYVFCVTCGNELTQTAEATSGDETLVVRQEPPATPHPERASERVDGSARQAFELRSAPSHDAKPSADKTLVVKAANPANSGAMGPNSVIAGQPSAVGDRPAAVAARAPVQNLDRFNLSHTTQIRIDQAVLRERPSRLAQEIRSLSLGETVRLQSYGAHFALVRTMDNTEGFVERRQLNQAGSSLTMSLPPKDVAYAVAALLALLATFFPWLTGPGSASQIGIGTGAGILVLLLALAGGAILVARPRFPDIPEDRVLWSKSAAGGLIVILVIIEIGGGGNRSIAFGLYLALLAGMGMAVAPWIERGRAFLSQAGNP